MTNESVRELLAREAAQRGEGRWRRIHDARSDPSSETKPKPEDGPKAEPVTNGQQAHAGTAVTELERKPRKARRSPLASVLLGIAGFVVAVAFWASLAPGPMNKPVPASTITPGAITGNPCGTFGRVVAATQLTAVAGSVGNNTYRVYCSDGVSLIVARP